MDNMEPKKPRKRWSVDTGFVHLPESKSISSSASSRDSLLNRNKKKPVPAPRTKLKLDTHPLICNKDEIIEIETSDRSSENTGIEMTEMTSLKDVLKGTLTEHSEHSPVLSAQAAQQEFTEMTEMKETILTIEPLSDSEDMIPLSNYKDSTVVTIERSNNMDSSGASSTRKIPIASSQETCYNKKRASMSKVRRGELDHASSLSSEEIVRVDKHDGDICSVVQSDTQSEGHEPLKKAERKFEGMKSQERFLGSEETEWKMKGRNGWQNRSKRIKNNSTKWDDGMAFKKEVCEERTSGSSACTKKSMTDSSSEIKRSDAKEYISVIVHKASRLEFDFSMRQLIARVHIVHATTGKYLKLKTKEEGTTKRGRLTPMTTKKFDILENGSRTPIWEDELIFEHDYDVVKKIDSDRILMFFEIIEANSKEDKEILDDNESVLKLSQKYAWAFLRPAGNRLYTDKKVKLQLYRYGTHEGVRSNSYCQVYNEWKKSTRSLYDSKLYVTVAAIDRSKIGPVFCQLSSLNGRDGSNELNGSNGSNRRSQVKDITTSCNFDSTWREFQRSLGQSGCLGSTGATGYDYSVVVLLRLLESLSDRPSVLASVRQWLKNKCSNAHNAENEKIKNLNDISEKEKMPSTSKASCSKSSLLKNLTMRGRNGMNESRHEETCSSVKMTDDSVETTSSSNSKVDLSADSRRRTRRRRRRKGTTKSNEKTRSTESLNSEKLICDETWRCRIALSDSAANSQTFLVMPDEEVGELDSGDSAGTYILEKADLESNDDVYSSKESSETYNLGDLGANKKHNLSIHNEKRK